VITEDGVYSAASTDNIAYWLQNPPHGRWLFLQGDQKVQHLVWRAPVNYSRDIFLIRAGEAVLTIRRQYLLDAIDASKKLLEAFKVYHASLPAKLRGQPIHSPMYLAIRRDSSQHGSLHGRIQRMVDDNPDSEMCGYVDILNNMTMGERWAMAVVTRAKTPGGPVLVKKFF
jgi:CRISPR type IV-associated protein Csf1